MFPSLKKQPNLNVFEFTIFTKFNKEISGWDFDTSGLIMIHEITLEESLALPHQYTFLRNKHLIILIFFNFFNTSYTVFEKVKVNWSTRLANFAFRIV